MQDLTGSKQDTGNEEVEFIKDLDGLKEQKDQLVRKQNVLHKNIEEKKTKQE